MKNHEISPENDVPATEVPDEGSAEDQLPAAKAQLALAEGRAPTRDEMGALKRVRKEAERQYRQRAYRYCIQGDYLAMCGRSRQQLTDCERIYGIPTTGRRVEGVGGGVIDLWAVVRWIHDFLAKHAMQIAANKRDGVDPTARAQIHDINLRVKQLELAELEKQLVRFDVMDEVVMELIARLKTAHDLLRQTVPADAMLVVEDAMAQIELYWRRKFGDETAAAEQRRQAQATGEWSI